MSSPPQYLDRAGMNEVVPVTRLEERRGDWELQPSITFQHTGTDLWVF